MCANCHSSHICIAELYAEEVIDINDLDDDDLPDVGIAYSDEDDDGYDDDTII